MKFTQYMNILNTDVFIGLGYLCNSWDDGLMARLGDYLFDANNSLVRSCSLHSGYCFYCAWCWFYSQRRRSQTSYGDSFNRRHIEWRLGNLNPCTRCCHWIMRKCSCWYYRHWSRLLLLLKTQQYNM